ncbi:MAG TPA: protealysin inhibitor emfourin [Anaerolineales bacterium]
MQIHFERSGGFTGMRLNKTFNSETLPADEANALQGELASANFFNLPGTIAAPAGGADRFHYRISVESGAQQHTVEVDEAAVPETLQPLLQHLTILARTHR